jgi:hypothetical protein
MLCSISISAVVLSFVRLLVKQSLVLVVLALQAL